MQTQTLNNTGIVSWSDNGKAKLSYEELCQTVRSQKPFGGYPSSRPLEHYELIGQIRETATKNHCRLELSDIHIDDGFCKVVNGETREIDLEGEKTKTTPLDHLLIDRLVMQAQIINHQDEDTGLTLGVNFNEKGIQLGYGLNVYACSNLCLFGDNLIGTYTNGYINKMNYVTMMKLVDRWLEQTDVYWENFVNIKNFMKNTEIKQHQVHEIYGKLMDFSINKRNNEKEFVLNVGQITSMIKRNNSESAKNLWEFYNHGTFGIKPDSGDISKMHYHINSFSNFLLKEFNFS